MRFFGSRIRMCFYVLVLNVCLERSYCKELNYEILKSAFKFAKKNDDLNIKK